MSRYYSDLYNRPSGKTAAMAQTTGYFDPYAAPAPSSPPPPQPQFRLSTSNSRQDSYQAPPLCPPGGIFASLKPQPSRPYSYSPYESQYTTTSYGQPPEPYAHPQETHYPSYKPVLPPQPIARSTGCGFFSGTSQLSGPRKRLSPLNGNNTKKKLKKAKVNNIALKDNRGAPKPNNNAPKKPGVSKPSTASAPKNVAVIPNAYSKNFVKEGVSNNQNKGYNEPLITMNGTLAEILEKTKTIGEARKKKFRFRCTLLFRSCGLKFRTYIQSDEIFDRDAIPFTISIAPIMYRSLFEVKAEGPKKDIEIIINDCVLSIFQKLHDWGIWSKEMIVNNIEKDTRYSKDVFQEAKLALLTLIQEVDKENFGPKIKDGTENLSPENWIQVNQAIQRAVQRIQNKDFAPDNENMEE